MVCFGSPWFGLGHIRSPLGRLAHFRSFWVSLGDLLRRFGSLWVVLAPFGVSLGLILVFLACLGSFWVSLSLLLGGFDSFWVVSDQFRPLFRSF